MCLRGGYSGGNGGRVGHIQGQQHVAAGGKNLVAALQVLAGELKAQAAVGPGDESTHKGLGLAETVSSKFSHKSPGSGNACTATSEALG
jgi:hypothetical protein